MSGGSHALTRRTSRRSESGTRLHVVSVLPQIALPVLASRGHLTQKQLLSPLAALDHGCKVPECVVDGIVVGEEFGNVRIDNDNIRSLCIALRVLSADSAREIVLFQHIWVILHFLRRM